MAADQWLRHGGEVDEAASRYGVPRERWLDLSTGINPIPYPVPELAKEYWYRLPDKDVDLWLREAAAVYYGVGSVEYIVPAAGEQALIQWLPRVVRKKKVAIVKPTYREHEAAWMAADHEVERFEDLNDVPRTAEVIVAVNPNNPDGRIFDPRQLRDLSADRLVIVDEAFADVAPELSIAPHVGAENLLVLRSVGKFFGLAGMRLGFALASSRFAMHLRGVLGPWAVSGPAAAVGAVALSDNSWIASARVRLTAGAGRLDGLLLRHGLRILGGTALFRLVEHAHAADLFDHLAKAGILTRRFPEQATWLRFGIPGSDADVDRLAAALTNWRGRAVARTRNPAA